MRENWADQQSLEDLAEGGDEQDNLAESLAATKSEEFFAFELNLIDRLLESAKVVRSQDEKLRMFIDKVVAPVVAEGKKLLIFTEYRATQAYLKTTLEREFPTNEPVLVINGSMKLDDKLLAIDAFNNGPNKFLISTEAGGEGLNLHRSCHIMVNYDLPWNPARLVQRIGRLYRYGQQETVVVFNLHARDSFDNAVIDLMMSRVGQIVQDMAPVGSEFNERLHSEILGDLLDQVDFAAILQSATTMEFNRTQEQIDEALARAKQAKQLQDEIFTHVDGFDINALSGTLGFTMQHVNLFVRGMLKFIGVVVEEELYNGRVLRIRLPEQLRGKFGEFAQRTVIRVTTDRRLAAELKDIVLLDFEASFFRYMIEHAKSHSFDGIFTAVRSPVDASGLLAAFKLRWQNDQGEPLLEEFVSVFGHAGRYGRDQPVIY